MTKIHCKLNSGRQSYVVPWKSKTTVLYTSHTLLLNPMLPPLSFVFKLFSSFFHIVGILFIILFITFIFKGNPRLKDSHQFPDFQNKEHMNSVEPSVKKKNPTALSPQRFKTTLKGFVVSNQSRQCTFAPPVNLLYQAVINFSVNQVIKPRHFVCFISSLTDMGNWHTRKHRLMHAHTHRHKFK